MPSRFLIWHIAEAHVSARHSVPASEAIAYRVENRMGLEHLRHIALAAVSMPTKFTEVYLGNGGS